VDAGRTLRGGIIYRELFIGEFAADQRQCVKRSINAELTTAIQRQVVVNEIEPWFPLYVTGHHRISATAGLAVFS
jgi:hypothetical protein